jgi:elongation factor Ts
MAEISAAAVKQLREETGLPLMDCKKALTECQGDKQEAIRWLRERGAKVMGGRAGRETTFGRFGIFAGLKEKAGAIVELKCESDPVAKNAEFVQLANDLARQLATGPGAATFEELLAQPSPSKSGMTLAEQRDELMNRIREVFNVGRFARLAGSTGGYSHNSGTVSGVLLAVEGGNEEAAKDVCMHIAAMRPMALHRTELPAEEVDRERAILREQALKEGKPANIVDKMVEGRLQNFFSEKVLLDQPFVKEQKQTVGKYAQQHGMKVNKYIHWELGRG